MTVQNKYLRYVFFATLFLSLLISLNVVVRRLRLESLNTRVEAAVSYHDMERLASLGGGMSVPDLLTRLRDEAGVTSVTIEEDTVDDYVNRGRVTLFKGSDVINMNRAGLSTRVPFSMAKPDRFYLIVGDKDSFDQIAQALTMELGKASVNTFGEQLILEVADEKEDLSQIGLGLSSQALSEVQDIGLRPIVRLKNSNRLSRLVIKQKILGFIDRVPQATVIFEGPAVLGFPTQMAYLEDKMIENNLRMGVVEFSDQFGERELAKEIPDRVVRVHVIPEAEMKYMPREEAIARYIRAAKERGQELLFIHPYFQIFDEQNIIDYNVSYIREIVLKLRHFHYKVEPIIQFPAQTYQPAHQWELLILGFGLLSTILFLINLYFRISLRRIVIFYMLFGTLFYACYFLRLLTPWSQIMALLTAMIFPTMAVISQFPKENDPNVSTRNFTSAFWFFSKVIGICMVGALQIAGFLSDTRFVFGIERFWAVKLAITVPLLFIGLYYFFRPHRLHSMFYILRRLFYAPVRTAALLSILVTAIAIGILLIRSGNHVDVQVMHVEDLFRDSLEQWLLVRPRTKEFLIGYPFLLVAYLLSDRVIPRQSLWFFMVLGSIALVSMTNSFCHVHTPIGISIYRSVLGAVLGFAMGYVYVLVYRFCVYAYQKVSI